MTNKTQCPNCLTVYIITDAQYQKSKGKVRCGTCRQPFFARFLPGTLAPSKSPTDQDKPTDNAAARGVQNEPVASSSVQSDNGNPPTNTSSGRVNQSTDVPQQQTDKQAIETAPFTQTKVSSITYREDFEGNLHSELTIEIDDEPRSNNQADKLISEVDSLIEEKLTEGGGDEPTSKTFVEPGSDTSDTEQMVTLDEPFVLDPKPNRSKLQKWLLAPLLLLLSVLLLVVLIYQLWLRQAVPALESDAVVEWSTPVLAPVRAYLDEQFGWQIPERRDLANLRLVSARVEPHPARPSTTLLKVSLVNQSSIAQPLPWLELVLTDVDGRLVSRRPLSPVDYLHNNRVPNMIRANELRPITIELLAFPRQAHGYELKIIDR